MSKKKRENTDNSQPTSLEQRPKIPFAHWFEKRVREGKLRHYQDEALLVFFRKQGLSNLEDLDTYNKTFEKF